MEKTGTNTRGSLWVGAIAALAASACCITPVLAALAGVGSLAGSLHWLAPARPYLLGLTVLALGYAWWIKLRPVPAEDCGCEVPVKPRFYQGTGSLVAITLFAIASSAFPLYAHVFERTPPPVAVDTQTPVQRIVIDVKGMTCDGCEQHVSGALRKVPGVASATASYTDAAATVTYDPTRTNIEQLMAAIDSTGYMALGPKAEKQ